MWCSVTDDLEFSEIQLIVQTRAVFLSMRSVYERYLSMLDSTLTEENHVSCILLLSTIVTHHKLMTYFAALLDVLYLKKSTAK